MKKFNNILHHLFDYIIYSIKFKNFLIHIVKMIVITMNEDISYEIKFNLILQSIQLSQISDIQIVTILYNIPRIKIKNQEYQYVMNL